VHPPLLHLGWPPESFFFWYKKKELNNELTPTFAKLKHLFCQNILTTREKNRFIKVFCIFGCLLIFFFFCFENKKQKI
jgi:hypothetical protein